MSTPLSPAIALTSKKRSLLIGNNSYSQGNKLRYCVNNARDIHDQLDKIDFQLTLGLDLLCEQIDVMIEDFVNDIIPGDLIIFFFSGYGIHSNNKNYLVPIDDDQISTSETFKDQTINIETIIEMIMNRRPSSAVFFFDCFHSYPIPNRKSSTNSIDYGGLSLIEPSDGAIIIYSCQPNQLDLNKSINGRNSLFTGHLMEYLIHPNIPIDEMMDFITSGILGDTSDEQCPLKITSINKNIYFNYQIQSGYKFYFLQTISILLF
jgi:uncharacterized caspase-like protein